jgi:hypothetical protein
VRALAGRAVKPSYPFLPADSLLRELAADVEEELRHVLRPPAEEAADAFEQPERRRSEITKAMAFTPVDAACRRSSRSSAAGQRRRR